MSYIEPTKFGKKVVDSGEKKLKRSTRDCLIRGYMAGAILALGAVMAVTITMRTGSPCLAPHSSPSASVSPT